MNLGDGGFLINPDAEYGKYANPDVLPFASIAEFQCLGLLGEPGIGKTYSIKREYETIKPQVKERGDSILWLNLNAYGSDSSLIRALSENPTFTSWKDGEHNLHLFLDSLDECLLKIDTVTSLLLEELGEIPLERLFFRIACRTADWRNSFERGLRDLWGKDKIGVFELVPLRRIDVAEAAEANSIESDNFLDEVIRKKVVALAIKPVTLKFLLNQYKKTGSFPETQSELYLEGCRLLCEEASESRRERRLTGNLTVEQRLAIAARIAAGTVLTKKYAVWTDIDQGDVPDEDVKIRELAGGDELVNGQRISVTESDIRETLSTGLFSSRGTNRLGWVHQTYAEFLAARYLVETDMTLAQKMSLIIHPGDPEGKVVPQLHETAAWLAGTDRDVFKKIMGTDPEVILRSDVAKADEKDRKSLVESLLSLFREDQILPSRADFYNDYSKLNHPELAEQLRAYMQNKNEKKIVRNEAIEIAEACRLKELQADLLSIALDTTEPVRTRANAGYALAKVGNNETKSKLKPLFTGQAGDDPEDILKSCGFQVLWPDVLTADELFQNLTSPQSGIIGNYRLFLSRDYVVKHLKATDLPIALKWAVNHHSGIFENIVDGIMKKAWEHLEVPENREGFAEVAYARMRNYERIVDDSSFSKEVEDNDTKRRLIIEAILPLIPDIKNTSGLVHFSSPVVYKKDLHWLLERLEVSDSVGIQKILAWLIDRTLDLNDPEHMEAVYYARQEDPILADATASIFDAVELDSDRARRARAHHRQQMEWEERLDEERTPLDPPPQKQISLHLDKIEDGDHVVWWQLNYVMMFRPDGSTPVNELESDLTKYPGWQDADVGTRARIIAAAKKYILEYCPEPDRWVGANTLYRPDFAGYRALRLLLVGNPEFLEGLFPEIWKRWGPVIIAYPDSSSIDDENPSVELAKFSYSHAPEELIRTLLKLVDKEAKDNQEVFIIRKVIKCWDDRLIDEVLKKIKDEDDKLDSKPMGTLLVELLKHKSKEARKFAESFLSLPLPNQKEKLEKAVVVSQVLVENTDDAAWSVVWPIFQQDISIGKQIMTKLCWDDKRAGILSNKLSENQLADLYIWLAHQYPYAEDPQVPSEAVYGITDRMQIQDFRDSILNHLAQQGTIEACNEISRVMEEFPNEKWIQRFLTEAREIKRQKSWIPPHPSHIIGMTQDRQRRFVQNGGQLLEVLIESLQRLEQELQGETPSAIDIWNKIGKQYKPKDENAFSDYVKRFLEKDLKKRGIIVNREVEIRRGEGQGIGERTDIHVDAVLRDSRGGLYDVIIAIIEVKGCWHLELKSAMETQLVGRYLKDNQCQHGLYLVGWFNCNQWDVKDNRKKQAPEWKVDEARDYFSKQASQLPQSGALVRTFVMNTALR